jgi:WD40 repeat protein
LVIGTKKGQLQVIHFKEGKPEILWQKQIYAQINDIKIGDVTNEGYNQIIVASDDSYVKIYDSEGKRISFIKIEEVETNKKSKDRKKLNRAKSLLIDDIDGDNANEIVVGSADGILRVYQNKSLNSKSFELKWRTSQSSGSIRGICTYLDEIKEKKIKNIIFGGYGRTLRNVFDFEYGKKPVLKIPVRFKASKPPAKKVPKKAEKKEEIKVVPTSLRGFIKELINAHGFYLTLDLLINELMLKGYDRKEIEDELEFLKSQGAMIYDKIDVNVWSLVSEEIDELIEKNTKKAK